MAALDHPRDSLDNSISDDLLTIPDDMLRQVAENMCRGYNRLLRRAEDVIELQVTEYPDAELPVEWYRLMDEAGFRG